VSVPGNLLQLTVGVNDVWGVNGSRQLFRYDFVSGTFIKVNIQDIAQVASGGDGVWFLDTSNDPYTVNSSTASFIPLLGVLKTVAVGSGVGVFGINNSDEVYTFVRP
jgi:hypothetical protein